MKGDDLEILVTQCPLLYKLKIEENKIETINNFFVLDKIKIRKINIKGNPFRQKEIYYRIDLFNKIKSLEAIDSKGKSGEEIESTEYGEDEDYCEEEDFEEAESGEINNHEENNVECNGDIADEENENEDEHDFNEEKNGDGSDEDDNSDKSEKN